MTDSGVVLGDYEGAGGSDRAVALLLGADADGLGDFRDEDLAITDFAGLGGLDDGPGGFSHLGVRDHQLDLDLGQEIHGVLAAGRNMDK